MTTMVERCAKAIYELSPLEDQAVDPDYRPLGPPVKISWEALDEFGDEQAGYYRDCARAAIAAMREPTEAMIEAAENCNGENSDAGSIYQAAIDEALK